jgi:hypothetical protein
MADDLRALLAALVEAVDALPFEFNWKGEPTGPLAEFDDGPLERARTALAEGAGVEVTDEELLELMPQQMRDNLAAASRGLGQLAGTAAGIHRVIFNTDALEYARAVLARYGTHPRPIPVAERLPTEADCDADGRCWWWMHLEDGRIAWLLMPLPLVPSLAAVALPKRTHWLPAAAIPLPEA